MPRLPRASRHVCSPCARGSVTRLSAIKQRGAANAGYQAVEGTRRSVEGGHVKQQTTSFAWHQHCRKADGGSYESVFRVSIIALALAVLGIGSAAAQSASIPIGKNGDVELTQPSTLGTTVLKPGHYRLKHAMQDGQHFLVVSRQQMRALRGGQHFAMGGGTEIARVVCQVVPLDAKVKDTALYTCTQPDGSHVITQIRIRGEGAGHLVALEPKG